MSSIPATETDMIVQNPQVQPEGEQRPVETIDKFPQPVPKIIINAEQNELPLPVDNKDHEPKSVYGESDIMSIMEQRNDQDNNPSQAGGKYKSTRRCFNEKCQSTTALKKLRSRVVANRYRNFCRPCYQNYINSQFCEFCQQVYDNQAFNQEDDNDWIGCDLCDRWNHVTCEVQKRNKNARLIRQQNRQYLCKGCANQSDGQKIQIKKSHKPAPFVPVKKRTARQIINHEKNQQYTNSNPNSVNIFARPKQGTLHLDSFLHSLNNYKLTISDYDIREDIRRIKQGGLSKEKGGRSDGKGR